MRAKADEGGIFAEALAAELADVQLLPDNSHFRVAGIANMRVVSLHDRL
jgi:hypothetical protein